MADRQMTNREVAEELLKHPDGICQVWDQGQGGLVGVSEVETDDEGNCSLTPAQEKLDNILDAINNPNEE